MSHENARDQARVFAGSARCVWCKQWLTFDMARGWIHSESGKLYETRVDPDGIERDDHCALPDYS